MRVAVGQALAIRSTEAWPRCEEPLSTIQHTRRAEPYGSRVMTCVTRSANGVMPVVGAHRPISVSRCTARGPVGDGAAPAVSLSSTCQSGGHRPNTAQVDQQRLERSPTRPPTVALTPIRHEPLGDLAGLILNRHPLSPHPTRSCGLAPP